MIASNSASNIWYNATAIEGTTSQTFQPSARVAVTRSLADDRKVSIIWINKRSLGHAIIWIPALFTSLEQIARVINPLAQEEPIKLRSVTIAIHLANIAEVAIRRVFPNAILDASGFVSASTALDGVSAGVCCGIARTRDFCRAAAFSPVFAHDAVDKDT
jgi:hypothetical protein